MDQRNLDKILQDHEKWLSDELGGRCAELRGADLRGADLRGTILRDADFRGADLQGANLRGANLWGAYLRRAYLRGADLQGSGLRDADLRSADLRGANLRGTILRGADLRGSGLRDADLRSADLRGADLRGTILRGADLRSADLRGADLRSSIMENADLENADMRGAKLEHAYTHGMKTDAATRIDWPMVCPETGAFVAWKQAGKYIVKLEIPEDAERSSATTNKCRASKAMVLEIQNLDGTKADATEVKSDWGKTCKLGEMVYPDDWDYNRWNECSHGIHFFMTRDEAVNW